MGATGSGKSTLAKLLARLFDPTAGVICLDNQLSSTYDLKQVRDHVTVLSQNSEIYPLSIRENIQLGVPHGKDADKSAPESAARSGGAFEMIQKLPQIFETVLDPVATYIPPMGGCPGRSSKLEAILDDSNPRKISISGM